MGSIAGKAETNETGEVKTGIEEESEETGPADTEKEEKGSSGSDTLVVNFSRTGEQYGVGVIDKGNTEIVACLSQKDRKGSPGQKEYLKS